MQEFAPEFLEFCIESPELWGKTGVYDDAPRSMGGLSPRVFQPISVLQLGCFSVSVSNQARFPG